LEADAESTGGAMREVAAVQTGHAKCGCSWTEDTEWDFMDRKVIIKAIYHFSCGKPDCPVYPIFLEQSKTRKFDLISNAKRETTQGAGGAK
jgi:hypothetical protein